MNKIGKTFLISGIVLAVASLVAIPIIIIQTKNNQKNEEDIITSTIIRRETQNDYFDCKFNITFEDELREKAIFTIDLDFLNSEDEKINKLLAQKRDTIDLYFLYDYTDIHSFYFIAINTAIKINYKYKNGDSVDNTTIIYQVGEETRMPDGYRFNYENFENYLDYIEQNNIDAGISWYGGLIGVPSYAIYNMHLDHFLDSLNNVFSITTENILSVSINFEVWLYDNRGLDDITEIDVEQIKNSFNNSCNIIIKKH